MTRKGRETLTSLRWNATDVYALDITKMTAIPGWLQKEKRDQSNFVERRRKIVNLIPCYEGCRSRCMGRRLWMQQPYDRL